MLNQSGFKPGDACINLLLSISHEIYISLDVGFDFKSVYLDISKAFEKYEMKVLLNSPGGYLKIDAYLLNLVSHDFGCQIVTLLSSYRI